jgi:hypothetical protein
MMRRRSGLAYGLAAAAFLAYVISFADGLLPLGAASLALGWYWSDPRGAARGGE